MLKIIKLPNKPTSSKNNGSTSTSFKNNNSKPAFRKNNGNNKVNGFSISRNDVEYTKKVGKLFKLKKSKSEKTF